MNLSDFSKFRAAVRDARRHVALAAASPDLPAFAARHDADGPPIVLVVANAGYLDLLGNCLRSLRACGVDGVAYAATDAEAAAALQREGLDGFRLDHMMGDLRSFAGFGTREFNYLMYAKLLAVLALLRRGYRVLYCDGDVVWKRATLLSAGFTADLAFQVDERSLDDSARPGQRAVCAGLFVARPTRRARALLTLALVVMRLRPTWHDQDAINYLLAKGVARLLGVRVETLDPMTYPNGAIYFGQDDRARLDPERVALVHANYVIGHAEKISAMRANGLWVDERV